ncbi:ankyrin repeat-containing protein NPR4-like isoform X1 [Euphorbia lathyris]|uniref:ankyrin repeat-containing protein NPR4-like isoform X1 n=1 Tax=Euphorbia lathyris TaxID=212925 RepID=UPI0033136675
MFAARDDGRHMDTSFYKAAAIGNFDAFKNLPHLLGRSRISRILHIHLNSPSKRSTNFVQEALRQCPELLWQVDNGGDIPLHIAAKYGHLEIVLLLLEEAKKEIHRDLETGEEEAVSTWRMLRKTNKQKETALHLAIRGGCLDVVQEILKHEDPNFAYLANLSGETPLYLAARLPNGKITIAILKKFKPPSHGGPGGKTALHAAVIVYFLNDSLYDLMLSKVGGFVNPADDGGWTPLHCAAYVDNVLAARKILEKDEHSAYATDKDRKRTALHIASGRGQVGVMKEIIDRCPECCEISDVRGWNVLHYAVISKSDEAVKAILKHPALKYLIIGQDIRGFTPLHLLMVSRRNSPVLSWIYSDKSGFPPQIFYQISSMRSPQETYRDKKRILEWMKELGRGPLGETIAVGKHWKELQIEREEKVIPKLENAKDSHLVVAALVATVTFAAAFTLPGGYKSDENNSKLEGTPILIRNLAFHAFVLTDAIAMVLSTSSVFIHFLMVMLGYKQRYYWLIRSSFWFVVLAMGAMVFAFVTGTYAVLAHSLGLAIATCVIGLTFFVHVSYTTVRLILDFIKRDRIENHGSPTTESLGRLLESAPQYFSCGCNWRRLKKKLR